MMCVSIELEETTYAKNTGRRARSGGRKDSLIGIQKRMERKKSKTKCTKLNMKN